MFLVEQLYPFQSAGLAPKEPVLQVKWERGEGGEEVVRGPPPSAWENYREFAGLEFRVFLQAWAAPLLLCLNGETIANLQI